VLLNYGITAVNIHGIVQNNCLPVVIFALLCSYVLQICDFGLAKWTQQAATQTRDGKRRGTFAYIPPEVFKDATLPRTVKYDVYSFGILLWELLSQKRPFGDGTKLPFCSVLQL